MKNKTPRDRQKKDSRIVQVSNSDHKVEREKSHPEHLKGKIPAWTQSVIISDTRRSSENGGKNVKT